MDTQQKTLDLVGRYYAAFNAKNAAGMLDCVADKIVHDVNQGERRSGKALFAEFCNHMDDCYSETLTDMAIMATADGRRAAAEFVVNGTYKKAEAGLPPAKGQHYVLPAGAFLEIEDGRITRVTTYYNLQDWIRQVEAA